MSEPSEPLWEIVYTMDDYHDGPLSGIANYCGSPYFYQAQWNELEEFYDHYQITPVNEEILKLALESWSIWNRWGLQLTNGSSVPQSLISDRDRYEQIQNAVREFLSINPVTAKKVNGKFRAALERVREPYLEVLWTAI
jgi:hypothetical protein